MRWKKWDEKRDITCHVWYSILYLRYIWYYLILHDVRELVKYKLYKWSVTTYSFPKMYISLWVELICYWVTGEEQQRQGQRFTECRFKECEVPTILGSQASSHHPLDVDPKFLSCNLTVPAGYFHPWVGRRHPNINTYTTRLWFKWSAACWSQGIFVHSILRVRPRSNQTMQVLHEKFKRI